MSEQPQDIPETEPSIPESPTSSLLDRIGRKKLFRAGATMVAAAGMGIGTIGAVKGVEAASKPLTPIEYAMDATGYKAEQNTGNLNDPAELFTLLRGFQQSERPYILVHLPGAPEGKEVRIIINSSHDLARDGELTDLGLAARDMLLRDREAMLFGRDHTPALQEEGGIGVEEARQAAKVHNGGLYTGAIEEAPTDLKDPAHLERRIHINGANGGYVEVVEPATPSLIEK